MFTETFTFTYTWYDADTGATETINKKMVYPEGASIYDERGPLEAFKEFMKGAGYASEIDFD